tara:strand:- start:226 stop:396 length:171 start_codon:yes stop_codon:yes gene_type:complete
MMVAAHLLQIALGYVAEMPKMIVRAIVMATLKLMNAVSVAEMESLTAHVIALEILI